MKLSLVSSGVEKKFNFRQGGQKSFRAFLTNFNFTITFLHFHFHTTKLHTILKLTDKSPIHRKRVLRLLYA